MITVCSPLGRTDSCINYKTLQTSTYAPVLIKAKSCTTVEKLYKLTFFLTDPPVGGPPGQSL